MILSPFEIIKKQARGLLDKGKSFFTAPDNTTMGIVRNTITGIPTAGVSGAFKTYKPIVTQEVPGITKEIAQGTARGLGTIGSSVGNIALGRADSNIRISNNPITRKTQEALYGKEYVNRGPISFESEGRDILSIVGKGKEGTFSGKYVAPVIGATFPLLDAIPGGKSVKTLLKSFGDDTIDVFVKSKNVPEITKYLVDVKVDAKLIPDIAKDIAKAKDIQSVKSILNSVPMPEAPVAKGVQAEEVPRQADDLATEAKKYNSAEKFIEAQGVQRIEEPGVSISFDKPQGLYTTPANVNSPHTDLGGLKTEFGIKPNAKEAIVDVSGLSLKDRGIDQMATNLVWLRQELPEVANNIRGKSFKELKTIFSEEFPKTEWNKYEEIQDMIEGYAGLKARQNGVDVIRGIDKTSPEFSEVVILNKDVVLNKSQLEDIWKQANTKLLDEAPLKAVDDIKSAAKDFGTSIEESPSSILETKISQLDAQLSGIDDAIEQTGGARLKKFISRKEGEFQDFKQINKMTPAQKEKYIKRNRKIQDIGSDFDMDLNDNPDAIREMIQRYDELTANKKQMLSERKSLLDALKESKETAQTELQSLQGAADSLPQSVLKADVPPVNTFKNISSAIEDTNIKPVTKTTIVDYLRTPDRVLNKLGLEEQTKNLRKSHENYLKMFQEATTKISTWKKSLPDESSVKIFRHLDGKKIDLNPNELKVAGEVKKYLSDWADKLELPKESRITNYITHIFDDGSKGIDKNLAFILDNSLPTGVRNPYEALRSGQVGYVEDVWRALDAYTSKATRKLAMDSAINDISNAAKRLDGVDWDYVKSRLDRINFKPTKLDTLTDNAIKRVLPKKLAAKLGERPTAKILSPLRAMGYRGTLGLNLGSALKNISQGVNTFAKVGFKNTLKGYAKLITDKTSWDILKKEGILNYGFIEDRIQHSSTPIKEAFQKMDDVLFSFFETAEKINRGSAYFAGLEKAKSLGLKGTDQIEYAKDLVRKTQFAFGEFDTPAFLDSEITKTVFQLQSFTVKQIEFLTEMALKDKDFAGLLRYAVGGWLFVNTIGQLFGMDEKDLIPSYRVGGGLVFQPVIEGFKSLMGFKDEYGNERDAVTRVKDFGKTLIPFVPAGTQIKKSTQGIQNILKGGSFTPTGKQKFEAPDTLGGKVQSVAFGPSATSEAKEYYDSGFRTSTPIRDRKELAQDVLNKLNSGEFGDEKVAEEYFRTELDKITRAERTRALEGTKKEFAEYLMKELDSGAITEKKASELLKTYQEQATVDTETKSKFGLIGNYAKAFFKDPSNAWKALVTKEKLGDVKGNLVQLQRFYGIEFDAEGGSQEYKKQLMYREGIPWKDKGKYSLEHIIPLGVGGDNSDENLMIVDKQQHDFYTPVEIYANKLIKEKKLDRKRASDIFRQLKVDKSITVEEAIEELDK